MIEVFRVAPENQDALVAALGKGQSWLLETPGYRSHSVLRGMRANGANGPLPEYERGFVVCYSQWESQESYDAYRAAPEEERPLGRRETQAQLSLLVTAYEWNSYRVVHTRSAPQQP